MCGGDKLVKIGPGTKMGVDVVEITPPVTVVACICAIHQLMYILDGRRNPDSTDSHTGNIGKLLCQTGKVTAPVLLPIGFRRIVQPFITRRIIIGWVTIEKAIQYHL